MANNGGGKVTDSPGRFAHWCGLGAALAAASVAMADMLRNGVQAANASLLGAMVVLVLLAARLKDVREIILGKDGVTARLDRVEDGVNETKTRVELADERITDLLLFSLDPGVFKNLCKCEHGKFGEYDKSGSFEWELRYLRVLGFIRADSITDIPKKGDELSKYVSLTNRGKDYIAFRRERETSNPAK